MNIQKLDSIELHDAVIKGWSVDFESGVVRVEVAFFPDSKSAQRVPVCLVFEEVTSMSDILDLKKARSSRVSGNVNYWMPNECGTTYIYLIDGCVAITAKTVRIETG